MVWWLSKVSPRGRAAGGGGRGEEAGLVTSESVIREQW